MQFDKQLLACSFTKSAKSYDQAAQLQSSTRDQLWQYLQAMTLQPEILLDLGAGTGQWLPRLSRHYPQAALIAVDIAFGMLSYARSNNSQALPICADAEALPLAAQTADIIVSNMLMHWCRDLTAMIKEWRRVLKPGAKILFATLGPSTLPELRASWAAADQFAQVHDFLDPAAIQAAFNAAGFTLQLEQTTLTYYYQGVGQLMQALKMAGTQNKHPQRSRTLLGKKRWQAMLQAYERYRNQQVLLPASYQVLYGIGELDKC